MSPELKRIMSYVDRNGGAGRYIAPGMDSVCWPWIGARTRKKQPVVWLNGKTIYPHVFLWEQETKQAKPPGRQLSPRCGWSMCVRPSHRQLRPRGSHRKVLA